jgi:hypothetical protein
MLAAVFISRDELMVENGWALRQSSLETKNEEYSAWTSNKHAEGASR